jgi:hypothetical protein
VTRVLTIQEGYSEDAIVNYQMLLPTPQNATTTYYFFTDHYDTCPPGGLWNNINGTVYGYVK